MSLLFHTFVADEASRALRGWRGSDDCATCQRTRFEHADVRHDAADWHVGALAYEIDSQLRGAWTCLREERRKPNPEPNALKYFTHRLADYFALRAIGLGRTSGGSLNATIRRKQLARIDARLSMAVAS